MGLDPSGHPRGQAVAEGGRSAWRPAAGSPGRGRCRGPVRGGGPGRIRDLVCFFKGAGKELLPQTVNTLLNVKLRETENGKQVSILI